MDVGVVVVVTVVRSVVRCIARVIIVVRDLVSIHHSLATAGVIIESLERCTASLHSGKQHRMLFRASELFRTGPLKGDACEYLYFVEEQSNERINTTTPAVADRSEGMSTFGLLDDKKRLCGGHRLNNF